MDVVGVGYVQLVRVPTDVPPHPNVLEFADPAPMSWELVGRPGPQVHWAIETTPDGVVAHVLDSVRWTASAEGGGYAIGIIDGEYGPLFAVGLHGRYVHMGDELSLTPQIRLPLPPQ